MFYIKGAYCPGVYPSCKPLQSETISAFSLIFLPGMAAMYAALYNIHMAERGKTEPDSFRTPEQRREFVRNCELEEQGRESLKRSLAKRADIRMEEIKEKANNPGKLVAQKRKEDEERKRRLIEESHQLALWEHDHPAAIQNMMNNQAGFKKGRWSQAEYDRRYRRRTTGWGKYGNSTRTKESQKMRIFIRHTGGVTLDHTPEWRFNQILNDREINESL